MAQNSELFGKCIRTYKGNLLCCIEVNGRAFFFYMNPKTGLRFISGHEQKRGQFVTSVEWEWALSNWNNAKVEILTGRDLTNAVRLGPEIAKSFTFCMSQPEVNGLPINHARSFY